MKRFNFPVKSKKNKSLQPGTSNGTSSGIESGTGLYPFTLKEEHSIGGDLFKAVEAEDHNSSSESLPDTNMDKDLGMTTEKVPIIDFLIKLGLQNYIKKFVDEEIEMETLEHLSDLDLISLVPEIGFWNRLCRARAHYSEVSGNNGSTEFNIIDMPHANLSEFFLANDLPGEQYLEIFNEQGIGIEELLYLSDDLLKTVVKKVGPWRKLCTAKAALVAQSTKGSDSHAKAPNSEDVDELEGFLKNLKLEKYLQVFRNEEMDYEDVLSIPESKLAKLISKAGPLSKIMLARQKLGFEQNSAAGTSNKNEISDEEMDDFEEEDMTVSDEENKETKTLNLLLLGETGVGKSTFINAFANYLTFETMEAAFRNGTKLLSLIPAKYTLTDANGDLREVSATGGGAAENEDQTAGQSATQACRSYYFRFPGGNIRLIDTPGIGDVRGIKQDKINLENILGFISQHEDLHGICILMQPNNSRLTATFTYCIKELLCNLQKDAARNIIFVFTNSRGTFYRPGDTAPSLKKLLDEIEQSPPHVRIPFVNYCFDNEAFRFLMALHNGITFEDDQHAIFSDSWRISVKECARMIAHIASLTPHKVKDTVSINEARRLIIDLSKPIADIAQNINVNLQVIQDRENELLCSDADMDDLTQRLKVPVVDLEQIQLKEPTTVCAASKCIQICTVGLNSKTNYVQKCHSPCYLTGVTAELLNNPDLLGCAAMNGNNCARCGCSYAVHMHIYYELKEVDNFVEDETIKTLISQKADAKVLIAQSIQTLQKRSEDLIEEKQLLTKAVAKFAIFLKSNAITPYNDAFQEYLEHLISNEKAKSNVGANNRTVIEGMQTMLAEYQEQKKIFDGIANGTYPAEFGSTGIITAAEIKSLEQELYAMKINGAKLKQFRAGYADARDRAQSFYSETVHAPPKSLSKKKRGGGWISSAINGVYKPLERLFGDRGSEYSVRSYSKMQRSSFQNFYY